MLFRMLGTSCTFPAWNNLAADPSIPVIQPAHYQSQSWKGTQETCDFAHLSFKKQLLQWSLFWNDSKRSFSLSVCGNWNSQRLLSKIKLRIIRISWRASPLAVLQWEAPMTQLLFESAGESNQSMRDIVAILLWLACLHLCFIGKRSKCMKKTLH